MMSLTEVPDNWPAFKGHKKNKNCRPTLLGRGTWFVGGQPTSGGVVGEKEGVRASPLPPTTHKHKNKIKNLLICRRANKGKPNQDRALAAVTFVAVGKGSVLIGCSTIRHSWPTVTELGPELEQRARNSSYERYRRDRESGDQDLCSEAECKRTQTKPNDRKKRKLICSQLA